MEHHVGVVGRPAMQRPITAVLTYVALSRVTQYGYD
jgi:hypothetical protein